MKWLKSIPTVDLKITTTEFDEKAISGPGAEFCGYTARWVW